MIVAIKHIRSSNLLLALLVFLLQSRSARAELPSAIRVITYNIHHGEGTDRKFDLPRIANLLLAEKPDIIALQEVDQKTRRASGVDQPAELARLTGMQAVFGRNIDFEGGGYGTAVLSRLPVRSSESIKLKSYYPPTAQNAEQRGVQVLEIGENGKTELLFLCTHLDYRPPDDERMNSAITINELIKKRGDLPAIIAGDLNAKPDSRPIREFEKEWKIAAADAPLVTFPADKPDRWIDYVMYRPAERWTVEEVRVLDELVASDHRPVLAVLRLKSGDSTKPQSAKPN
jgi:endonuclease/exonuclease/phosphatase family metal-dependent hydrolase